MSHHLKIVDMAVPAADGNSDEVVIAAGVNRASVFISGTFSAKLQVQVSPTRSGDNWTNESQALPQTSRSVDIHRPCCRVRIVVTDYVSGTPVGTAVFG